MSKLHNSRVSLVELTELIDLLKEGWRKEYEDCYKGLLRDYFTKTLSQFRLRTRLSDDEELWRYSLGHETSEVTAEAVDGSGCVRVWVQLARMSQSLELREQSAGEQEGP